MVASFGEVLLDDDTILMLDEMPFAERACFIREQHRERKQKAERGQDFAPPPSPYYHNTEVEGPQPTVRRTKPASRPAYRSFPLSGSPDEEGSDKAAHQGDLLRHLDEPVDGAAEAGAIFARAEEKGVDEEAVPEAEDEDEEGVETATT